MDWSNAFAAPLIVVRMSSTLLSIFFGAMKLYKHDILHRDQRPRQVEILLIGFEVSYQKQQ